MGSAWKALSYYRKQILPFSKDKKMRPIQGYRLVSKEFVKNKEKKRWHQP